MTAKFKNVEKIINEYDGIICDLCGKDCSRSESMYSTDISFGFHQHEEDNIEIQCQVCYDCYEKTEEFAIDIANKFREFFSSGIFISPLVMGWPYK